MASALDSSDRDPIRTEDEDKFLDSEYAQACIEDCLKPIRSNIEANVRNQYLKHLLIHDLLDTAVRLYTENDVDAFLTLPNTYEFKYKNMSFALSLDKLNTKFKTKYDADKEKYSFTKEELLQLHEYLKYYIAPFVEILYVYLCITFRNTSLLLKDDLKRFDDFFDRVSKLPEYSNTNN